MGSEPRRARITDIADATNISRARAGQILKAAGMRERFLRGTFLRDKAIETINALKDPAMSAGNRLAGRAEGASSDAIANSPTPRRWQNRRAPGNCS